MADASAVDTSWIQTGGLALFASAVLMWLRDFRKELTPVLTDIKTLLAALLERERARGERLAAKDAAATRYPRQLVTPAGGIPEVFEEDPETAPITTVLPSEKPQRAQTNPGGQYLVTSRSRGGGG